MSFSRLLPQVFALLLLPAAASAQVAALKDQVPHITVIGHAHTEVVPNIATLSLAVVTERPKADDAATENAKAAQAVIDQIKAEGIEARDIKTSSITLSPVYDEASDSTHALKQVLRGYSARNSIEVRVRALDKVGGLARKLIDSGANQLEGIDFSYEHDDEIYDKLRDEAMQDAARRAKSYLPSTSVILGRILEISPPDAGSAPRARLYTGATMAAPSAESAPIPIEPGTLTFETEVQVTWELIPK